MTFSFFFFISTVFKDFLEILTHALSQAIKEFLCVFLELIQKLENKVKRILRVSFSLKDTLYPIKLPWTRRRRFYTISNPIKRNESIFLE